MSMTFKEWRAEIERQKILQGISNKELADKTGYTYKYLINVMAGRQVGQPCMDAISTILGIEPYVYAPEDTRAILERG